MNCSECGEDLPQGARFCSGCGRRVPKTIACPQCDAQVAEGARFCFNCGAGLAKSAASPAKVEPVLQAPAVEEARSESATPSTEAPKETVVRQPPPVPMPSTPKRTVTPPPRPAAATERGVFARRGPLAMVVAGALLGIGAIWSANHDDATSKAEAQRRMVLSTGALPTTTQPAQPKNPGFSTRQALQGMYGAYDPHLDGVFWTVSGAPKELGDWNGKSLLIKPLISRSDESSGRHVLVTNSVDVKNGLVVKQGAGCRTCKSLLGAALFERRGDEWVLVKEQRFMRVEGAWGAPPKVLVDFPVNGGAELRIESASAESGRPGQISTVVLQGGRPASVADTNAADRRAAIVAAAPAAVPAETKAAEKRPVPAREELPVERGSDSGRALVSAAVKGDEAQVNSIVSELKRQPPARGDRGSARALNSRGLTLARERRYPEAIWAFRQAHQLDPSDAEVRENLGYSLLKAGRVTEAEAALVAALEVAPERATAWGSLGHVYAKQGKREQAVALLRRAHRVAPDPKRVLDTYARQAETDEDPQVRAMLAEAVTRISNER